MLAQRARLRATPGPDQPRRALRDEQRRALVDDARGFSSSKVAPAYTRPNDTKWNDWFRSVIGLRYDRYHSMSTASSRKTRARFPRVSHRLSCRWCLAPGPGPNTLSTRVTVSTATTRAASRSASIRRPAIPSIRRRRWFAAKAPSLVCEPRRSRTSSHRWRCGTCHSPVNSCSSVMPAPPRLDDRRSDTASIGRRAGGRSRGCFRS